MSLACVILASCTMLRVHQVRKGQKAHLTCVASVKRLNETVAMRRGPLDLAPWLYVTPAELAPFRDLLLRLGAREAFSAAQYAAVLAAMAKRASGQPLDAVTLAQAISIVQVCNCTCNA